MAARTDGLLYPRGWNVVTNKEDTVKYFKYVYYKTNYNRFIIILKS